MPKWITGSSQQCFGPQHRPIMAKRLQQKRTKDWRKPENAVVVSRPTKWGNPFAVSNGLDRAAVVRLFREWIASDDPAAVKLRQEIGELRGKDLLCWCPVGGPCHGDVLLALANDPAAGGS